MGFSVIDVTTSQSQSSALGTAQNSFQLSLNPTISNIIGGGSLNPNNSGTGQTANPSQTPTSSQTTSASTSIPISYGGGLGGFGGALGGASGALGSLLGPAPGGTYGLGTIGQGTGGLTGLPSNGVTAKLSSTTLLLLGGLGLLLVMSMGGGGGRRR